MRDLDPRRRFEDEVTAGGLLGGAARILVACSGGSDSTALLLLLDGLVRATPPRSLWIGHVNHGLRGAESDADEEFVRKLGRTFGRPVVVHRADVDARRRATGESLEEAARSARYDAFREWADALALDAIALGHTREDQQETVLLRLVRGSGIRGLAAMRTKRPLEGVARRVEIIRPLLGMSRAELRELLERAGSSFREDSSNELVDRPRNVLRHQLLPLLEREVFAGARRGIERSARMLREALDELEARARQALEAARLPNGEGYDTAALRSLPRSVLRELLVLLVREEEPSAPAPSEIAFRRFVALLHGPPGRAADLGGGVLADHRYGRIRVHRRRAQAAPPSPVELEIDGAPVRWGPFVIEVTRRAETPLAPGAFSVRVSASALRSPLIVRERREGDRYRPHGAPGRRKLKELFRDVRVAPRDRDAWPVIASGDAIVWLPGHRVAHDFAPRDDEPTVTIVARRIGTSGAVAT